MASTPRQLTLKDITSGFYRPESMPAVTPSSDGTSYLQTTDNSRKVTAFSFKTGKPVATLFDAATAKGFRLESIDGFIPSPDGKKLLIQTETEQIYRRSFKAVFYIYDIANQRLQRLSDGGKQQCPVWSPDGEQVAFVRDGDIFLVKLLYGNSESRVTKDGEKGKVSNGVADWVCEEEFSTVQNIVFTADSRQIVCVRYDESDVEQYPLLFFKGRSPEREENGLYPSVSWLKYPKAGEKNSTLSLHSFDIKSRQTRTMQLPLDADGYIPRIMSTGDADKIAVFTLNRRQDVLRIYMANPLSTLCRLAVEDRVDKYINEDVFTNAIATKGHLVLTSERDGFNRIYVYSLTGQLQRTVGDVPAVGGLLEATEHTVVTDVYLLNEATGDLFFAAHPQNPLEKRVYAARGNGRIECLTEEEGWHDALFAADGHAFLDTHSAINRPPVTTLRDGKGRTSATVVGNEELSKRLKDLPAASRELFAFQTGEGVRLAGWMVKPAGFNETRKYPVVIYQYGGPGNQQVRNAWGIGMNGQGAILEQLLAQEGFVVVCVDGRGTGGRGAAFEKQTYLRLGLLEARDQVETALYLGSLPFVDAANIAIWGWSYGGWNTLMAMTEGRPVFKAGIAIAPPTSWRFYDTVYTERFMRTPKENQHAYDDISPIARAEKLSGKLLLVHGLADDNVHFQNTAELTEALVEADKDFSQLVYTNRNHSIYGGNTRNHLFRQCLNFFNDNLKK